jgi:hypothetical protein
MRRHVLIISDGLVGEAGGHANAKGSTERSSVEPKQYTIGINFLTLLQLKQYLCFRVPSAERRLVAVFKFPFSAGLCAVGAYGWAKRPQAHLAARLPEDRFS